MFGVKGSGPEVYGNIGGLFLGLYDYMYKA